MTRVMALLVVLFVLAASSFVLSLRALGARDDVMALALCLLGAVSVRAMGRVARAR